VILGIKILANAKLRLVRSLAERFAAPGLSVRSLLTGKGPPLP